MQENQTLCFLDIETTGTDPKNDAIIELACVRAHEEMGVFSIGTDANSIFHFYLNTTKEISKDSIRVHGITKDMLVGKPFFHEIVDDLIAFIGDRTIIAHNASFDIGFLNESLASISRNLISNRVIDSLAVARKMYPGSQVGLDALMRRFNLPKRNLHSALEDATILAQVYAAMHAPKQNELFDKIDDIKEVGSFKISRKIIPTN